jgi:ABC-type Na+ transport system ATPase subunit NatA
VALIDKGKILETGKPDELKKKFSARNLEEVFIGAMR